MSYVFKAYGAYKSGKEDAHALREQGDVASNQALADEAATRRDSRQFLGRQAAGFAQAGIGAGGTAALLMSQSNVLANLDALNVRYRGNAARAQKYGEAALAKTRGKRQAALELLKGYENSYGGGG